MSMMMKDNKEFCTTSEYLKKLNAMESSQIEYIRNDALSAASAMPDGVNADFYRLEVSLCNLVLSNRSHCIECNCYLGRIEPNGCAKCSFCKNHSPLN